jgi:O-succinylbenzoic acid--CoA ligase
VSAFSVRDAAAEFPDRVALVCPEMSWTYAELAADIAEQSTALAEAFSRTGRPCYLVGERSVVALQTLYAALDAGVPLYLVHPRWTEPERARAVARSGPNEASLRGSGLLAFVHTSGSTGTPKAIALSAAAFEASAAASATNLGWQDQDRWLLAMTPAHVGGLSIVTRCLAARRTVVVAAPGRFEPGALLDLVARQGVTLLSLVPTMLSRLMDLLDGRPGTFPSSLRAILVGGGPIPRQLLARCRAAGVAAVATYGLTETCSQVATQSPSNERPGAPALPGVDLVIREGEIHVGGPTLLSGVLVNGHVRPPALRDGRYPTGDLGRLLDGRLHVFGRADDRIITGGENVDPAEVESALQSLPGVSSAVVFGVPDDEWGQVVSAAIVPVSAELEPEEVVEALREHVSGFRLPRRWHILEEAPMTATGKIDRLAVIAALRVED